MGADQARRIENAIGVAAAAALSAATAFVGYKLAAEIAPLAGTIAISAVSALIGFMVGKTLLRILEGAPPPFSQPLFEVVQIEPVEVAGLDELLLTEAEMVAPAAVDGPLILDDVLAKVAPNARVVSLFDPAAMPTAGQLKAKIDHHLDRGTPRSPPPDASDALFAALADLRRSLR